MFDKTYLKIDIFFFLYFEFISTDKYSYILYYGPPRRNYFENILFRTKPVLYTYVSALATPLPSLSRCTTRFSTGQRKPMKNIIRWPPCLDNFTAKRLKICIFLNVSVRSKRLRINQKWATADKWKQVAKLCVRRIGLQNILVLFGKIELVSAMRCYVMIGIAVEWGGKKIFTKRGTLGFFWNCTHVNTW